MKRNFPEPALSLGFTGDFHAPMVMDRAHQHQELEINFVTQGSLTYLLGGGICRVPKGRLALLWAAAPHQVVAVEEGSRFYWFTLPFAWVLQWKLPRGFVEHLLKGRLAWDLGAGERNAANCERWFADLKSDDEDRLRAAQLEMEACLLRLASGRGWRVKTQKDPAGPAGSSPAAIQKMLAIIARRYTEPLSVGEITGPTGLHANYASSLFRRTLGVTIADYVKQHRLFHARRLLAVSDKKIVDVALESGFGALSRFYEAFVKAYGCSPKTVRRQLKNEVGKPGRRRVR